MDCQGGVMGDCSAPKVRQRARLPRLRSRSGTEPSVVLAPGLPRQRFRSARLALSVLRATPNPIPRAPVHGDEVDDGEAELPLSLLASVVEHSFVKHLDNEDAFHPGDDGDGQPHELTASAGDGREADLPGNPWLTHQSRVVLWAHEHLAGIAAAEPLGDLSLLEQGAYHVVGADPLALDRQLLVEGLASQLAQEPEARALQGGEALGWRECVAVGAHDRPHGLFRVVGNHLKRAHHASSGYTMVACRASAARMRAA